MELGVYGENYLLIGSTAISGKTCFFELNRKGWNFYFDDPYSQ